MLIKPTSPRHTDSIKNTTNKIEHERTAFQAALSLYLSLSYINLYTNIHTRIYINITKRKQKQKHSNTYSHKDIWRERNPKNHTEHNTQNYYLNTIKGNKFMFLHCLYKTNKEEEKKPNKNDRCFIPWLWLPIYIFRFFRLSTTRVWAFLRCAIMSTKARNKRNNQMVAGKAITHTQQRPSTKQPEQFSIRSSQPMNNL